jgi:hypothetical protein
MGKNRGDMGKFRKNAEIWEKGKISKTRRYGKIGKNIINAEIWENNAEIWGKTRRYGIIVFFNLRRYGKKRGDINATQKFHKRGDLGKTRRHGKKRGDMATSVFFNLRRYDWHQYLPIFLTNKCSKTYLRVLFIFEQL